MNKQLLCLFLVLCIFIVRADRSSEQAFETKDNVNRATELLQELLNDVHSNLNDLDKDKETNKPLLEKDIQNQNDVLAQSIVHCKSEEAQLKDYEDKLQTTRDYIEYLKQRMVDNLNRLDSLNQARCQQNASFIKDMKNYNLALRLIEFLRIQIQNKDNFSLIEKKLLMQKINVLFQLYEQHDTNGLQLLQQYVNDPLYDIKQDYTEKGRNAEQIGNKHIDNNKDDLSLEGFVNGERQTWAGYKRQLLDLLDKFEAKIKENKSQAQQDEINSAMHLAEFQAQVEKENKELAKSLEAAITQEAKLVRLVEQYTQNSKKCREQISQQEKLISDSEEYLKKKISEYNSKRAALLEEIQLLEEVLAIYNQKVQSNEDDFKDRVDAVSEGNFDDSYNKREVPEYRLLGN
ncbi:hypothetical protein IMG5_204130 [Ichthyophthirius multifiliis]|uniref:Uncharacterized protein n=1 Tax=Ichthyophthirius multifiliis TaxID=5932 RepID=G0R6E0_ICHMU|nr:hypothetical protein IMG5_204130 [Ichthyophthirius multifiliis]EGR26962.1 hypothetical protein IMG5_204130 [Ichthyophthirius multifiliis]|eukprot:XP_004023846.1 hypothetical protein IMG5_204130 [Ichthyophthirius multifiliis]